MDIFNLSLPVSVFYAAKKIFLTAHIQCFQKHRVRLFCFPSAILPDAKEMLVMIPGETNGDRDWHGSMYF